MGGKAQVTDEEVMGQRTPLRKDGEWVSIPRSMAPLSGLYQLMSDFTTLDEKRALALEPGRLLCCFWASVALDRLSRLLGIEIYKDL
jgi:hypothetical protein